MFPFDIDKIQIEQVRVKRITEALGGSISVVDEVATALATAKNDDGRETIITKRIEIPYAVARTFKKRNKGRSEYIVPVDMALVWYDGAVVCVEKRNDFSIVDPESGWDPNVSFALRRNIPDVLKEKPGKWFTDGVVVYRLPDDYDQPDKHSKLTNNQRFFAVSVSAFKFADMTDLKLISLCHTRTLVGFITKTGRIAYSPPVWSNVMDIRSSSVRKINKENGQTEDETKSQPLRFDIINDNYLVNLEFILNAAKTIGPMFGYDKIAFLQLERHMIQLNTVNLPKIPKAKRSTYDTGLNFLISFAWLLGYCDRCETLAQYVQLRSVFKVLCNNGLFSIDQVKKSLNIDPPEQLSKEDALVSVSQQYSDAVLGNYWMNKGRMTIENRGLEVQQFLVGSNE